MSHYVCGSSLGAALSMLSLNLYADDGNWGYQQSEMFIFSPAGFGRDSKKSLWVFFNGPGGCAQLHAS